MLLAAISDHPLGTVITASEEGVVANHLPFIADWDGGPLKLCAHLAKGSDQVPALRQGVPALVVFQGAQGYISPSHYPAQPPRHDIVPTWNYIAVHATGIPSIIDDNSWLRAHLEHLTMAHEQSRRQPWSPNDARPEFIAAQLEAIVGLEISVQRLEGKWKLSQNRAPVVRIGIADELHNERQSQLADAMVGTLLDADRSKPPRR